jgi:hypothetical protein
MVLSKTDREAVSAGEIVTHALQLLPPWMKPQMKLENQHEKSFADTNSSVWFYTPKAARGKSLTWLFIDEAAFIDKMEVHWAAMYPTVSTGGSVGIISTVNGLGNWYEEQYHEAEMGRNAFRIVEMDYWEHPDYNNPKWVADTKANLGPKRWAQEVLRSFLGSGNTFIPAKIIGPLDRSTRSTEITKTMYNDWLNESQARNAAQLAAQAAIEAGADIPDHDDVAARDGALWVWKTPAEGREYVIGVDVGAGMGEGADNSCFQVLDKTTLEQVAEFYSNSCPPHLLAKIVEEVGHWYNTAQVVVEDREEGHTVLSKLQNDFGYDNLWADVDRQHKPGLATSPTSRSVMMELLQTAMLNESVVFRSTRFVDELKTFNYDTKKRKPKAESGRHDDAIMAICMCLYAVDRETKGLPVGAGDDGAG